MLQSLLGVTHFLTMTKRAICQGFSLSGCPKVNLWCLYPQSSVLFKPGQKTKHYFRILAYCLLHWRKLNQFFKYSFQRVAKVFTVFPWTPCFLPSDWFKNIITGSRGKVILIKVTQCFPLRINSQLIVHFEWENSNLQCHLEKKKYSFSLPIFLRELLVPLCWRAGFDILHQDNKDVRDTTIKRACSYKTPNLFLTKPC